MIERGVITTYHRSLLLTQIEVFLWSYPGVPREHPPARLQTITRAEAVISNTDRTDQLLKRQPVSQSDNHVHVLFHFHKIYKILYPVL